MASPASAYSAKNLIRWWGNRTIDDVRGETCRAYVRDRRVASGTARRDLGVLQAAINYAVKEGVLTERRQVTLPPGGAPRERWLTRSEVARLLWAARRRPHLARFILIAVYTGTRRRRIFELQWGPNTEGGHIDVESGRLHRSSAFERQTNKRAPTVRLPRQLLLHCRRWRAEGRQYVIEYNGRPVREMQDSLRACIERAGVSDVTAHVFRHTAITWAMQRGGDVAQVASYFGASLGTIQKTYWHHHPDYHGDVIAGIERGGRK